jgi:hypothetical protein
MKNACKIIDGRVKKKRSPGRSRHRRVNSIKTQIQEALFDDVRGFMWFRICTSPVFVSTLF